jgi:hypothetical protein
LKIDPYNEQAQLQMRVLGGTTTLELGHLEPRRVEPQAQTHPDGNIGVGDFASPGGVIEMPKDPSARRVPPMEDSSVAPDSLLRTLRTEWTTNPPSNEPLEETEVPAENVTPSRSEEFMRELPAKVKPLPGRFVRFTAKNRPVQITLIALGMLLALFLFLILWFHLIPNQPLATLINGPAKKYIPDPAALPASFTLLDTPASNAVISLPDKGEGYRMVFTNPDFAAQHRETSVTYEVIVFNNDVEAQVNLLSAADLASYRSAGKIVETDSVAPNLLAKVDTSALVFARKDQTLQGNPAISYTLLLREVNVFARITVSAPVTEVDSAQAQALRGPLYQAVFYYASLLTGKLPLPASSMVTVNPPTFPVVP